jgi:signal transduction histidine kinase/DNA-binding response OmpR family regulator
MSEIQEPDENKYSARWKGLAVGALVLIATILCSAVLHFRAMAALRSEVQDKLLRVARGTAARIDGDLHRTFKSQEQESSPEYVRALAPLRETLNWRVGARLERNDYHFIYTCVLDGEEVRFVLDPTESKLNSEGIDEKSHIWQAYPDASERLLHTLKTGEPQADQEPYTDQWGTFVSGYAPFFDSAGKLAGAVGVDWRAETYAERLSGIRRAWYLQIVLCLASGFLSGIGTGVAMARRARAESARRHAIEEARRNRERWRIMVETLPKPALHLQEGELWCNDALLRTLKFERDALKDLDSWFEKLFGDKKADVRSVYDADRAGNFGITREVVATDGEGRVRCLEITAHAYQPGEVWLVEDITERKEYQGQLITARDQAEAAARAKGAFLATVSHEIRTPMNGVLGMANLLLETPLDPRQREMADTIRNSGEALVFVINDILDYSKIESGGMELESEPFDVRSCVEDCLQLFGGNAAQKGLELFYTMPRECPGFIRGDAMRLRQILCNLIGNAVKFTEKGEVEVRVIPISESSLVTGDHFTLAIEVRDTGIGIPPERMGRLFKSFSQVDSSMARKYGGTGLGLAISQKLAELMGGAITVTSEPGRGSVFRLALATRAEHSSAFMVHAPRPSLNGVRVLLVENHAPTAAFVVSYMREWGMDCTIACNAAQATRQLRDFGPYAIVVTTMQMPDTDGLAFCRELRGLLPVLPKFVLLSSLVRDDIVREARALGIEQVVSKPIRPATLLQCLEIALGGPEVVPQEPSQPAGLLAKELPLKILVAEDNAVNQLVARHSFKRLGYDIQIVGDGAKAVAAAGAEDFDIIFMDVQMPEMNGFEATQRIRALPDKARRPWIIALTANALEGDRDVCLRYGMDDYLSKPMRFADLERALRSALI